MELAYDALKKLRDMGLALLVVEQDLTRALDTADDLMVMCEGHVTMHKKPRDTSIEALAAASFGHEEEVPA